jgi:hypothetical protein
VRPAAEHKPNISFALTVVAVASTAAGLAAAYGLASAGVGGIDGFGGLLRFREDGARVEAYGLALVVGFAGTVVLTVGSLVSSGRSPLIVHAANLTAKTTLVAAAVFMFVFSDLSQFEAKSLTYRAVLYPLLAFMFPVIHVLRGAQAPYPGIMDLCLTFAVTFDILSNDLHYYGNWKDWDDLVHFFNSLPIMVVIVVPILALEDRGYIRLGLWGSLLFGFTIYATVHALWEMAEFLLDEYAGTNLQPGGMAEATGNNLSSLGGAFLAVAMIWWWHAQETLRRLVVSPFAMIMGPSTMGLEGAQSERYAGSSDMEDPSKAI